MADPPTPPDPNVIDASQNALERMAKSLEHVSDVLSHRFGDAVQGAQKQLGLMTEGTSSTEFIFEKLGLATNNATDAFKKFQEQTSKLTDGTTASAQALSVLTLGAIGAGKAFQTVGNLNFENLNSFTDQINTMVDSIGNNTTVLGKLANSLGFIIPASVGTGAKAIGDFIKNTAAGADNAMRAERAYMQLGAQTGDLGNLHRMAGEALKNLGDRTLQHSEIITGASRATNQNREVVERYYSLLGKVPGALEANVGGQTALTQTTLLALGTGRDYADIIDDVHTAIREYSASIPDAIKFTAQISAISEAYNVELKDVETSLKSTANAFQMFGNVSLGAQNILNNYLGTLKETGLSGAAQTSIITNMTGAIEKMGIAQKSFLSAQTGGPGGLMGAFRVDQMLRTQDGLSKVFEMVRSQLTKQMGGRLVGLDEAAQSQQGAAQMTRQITTLQAGPLGSLARSPQEAERIIEMFMRRQRGGAVDPKSLETMTKQIDYTKLGTEYAKQSSSSLSRIVQMMQGTRATAGFGALGAAQRFTNAADLPGSTPGFMERGQRRGMEAIQTMRTEDSTGVSLDTLPKAVKEELNEYEEAKKDLMERYDRLKQDLDLAPVGSNTIQEAQTRRRAIAPGTQLRTAAADASTRTVEPTVDTAPGMGAQTGSNSTLTAGPAGSLILHNRIEGLCINCGVEMQGSEQQFSVNTASKTTLQGH